ncbi:MAG: 3-dehydroquinate dehydratase [Bacteroidales bacterium]|jgi:3-dehydroquinate dehydratase-2|nr:3-dehydroquinate dehydratase [Bacteroidales bacterium]HOY39832.1 type II 3-dehydroquinate dehydratase [Bacteroidales bacterium]
MKKLLIINGPNLNLLGIRETELYGEKSLADIITDLRQTFIGFTIDEIQSNSETEIVDVLQHASNNYHGVAINAGAFTHTSVSIRDAVAAINIPVVELHITNTSARELFRATSLISPVCKGTINGFGYFSYHLAVYSLINL